MLVLSTVLCLGAAAQSSVLATGEWWRLRVETAGVYRVTTADVPALAGADVARIGVYGAAGGQLSVRNRETSIADLQPLAIDVVDRNGNGVFDSGDEVLFFGEGADVWRWDTEDLRWEMRRHAYATANYYYLTTSAASPRRIAVSPTVAADTTLTSYTAVAAVNNDLVNLFNTGQVWLGEKFTSSLTSRSFTLTLPTTASDIKLRYALANKSSRSSSFNVETAGLSVTHVVSARDVYDSYLEATSRTARSLTFNITFHPGESTAEGYLDYIEMTGRVPLAFGGGQLVVRDDPHSFSTASFLFGGTARVWNVTRSGGERELAVSGGAWSDSAAAPRQYVVFDGSSYRTPAAVSHLANQDLHGSAQADYVVVCNAAFLSQANRLASLHEIVDGISSLVVTDEQVYNEFSSGKQDPMAIRSFMRSLQKRHPSAPPRWLLLFGKASYDARDLKGLGVPTVVTFETPESFDEEGQSYCSDNMMGYLGDDERGITTESLDLGIGRLPAKSGAEADHMVDKIEKYMMRADLADGTARGDWRNYVALLADDADPSHGGDTSFAHLSETTARRIKAAFPAVNIDRLYADAYIQQSGAIGSYYPDLNNALRQRMDYGCLLLNYVGHGSQKYIGTERYIEPSDIAAYKNVGRWPLMLTMTCSYGHHDIPDDVCGAELCLLADGAAVAVISAARPISVSKDDPFTPSVILNALNADNTIGDALRLSKSAVPVSHCIELTGDPALHLSVPRNKVVVTHIDGREVTPGVDDTATVLSQVTVSGEIHDADGQLLTDFDGTVYPIVFDRETEASTLANDNIGTELRFMQQKSVLYKGSEAVSGGRFEYTFTVPRDVAFQFDYGKLSHYAVSGNDDATGSYGNLLFGGLNEDVVITETRPDIRLFMGDTCFLPGGLTDENPTLVALLSDSVGINAFGSGLGHDITATIDNNAGSLVVLNDFYQPDVADSRGGTVRYTFQGLAPGFHVLTLKAWNIWGYSSTATVAFRVRGSDTATFAAIKVYPNPATDCAVFHYETNNTQAVTSAVLHLYSSHGALVGSLVPEIAEGSYVVGPVRWNVANVPPGVYMARMLVTTADGETHQSTTKCVVR